MTTTITQLPKPPSRLSAPATFSEDSDTFLDALPRFVTETNTVVSELNSLAGGVTGDLSQAVAAATATANAAAASAAASKTSSAISANSAAQSAVTSKTYANASASSANFKGPWVNLSGPLSMPASVSHNGRDWRLNNGVANVALEEPGVSPAWSGMVTVDVTMEVSTDTTLIPGVYYIVTMPGITLSIPDTVYLGERYSVSNVTDDKIYIDWKSYTVKGKVPDLNMAVPKRAGFSVIYSGSTFA